MTKEQKAEYDRAYRERKKETIRLKKKLYAESEAGRQMQKRQRVKRKEYHNAFCSLPEQRPKEKHRRHIRENKIGSKFCIICETDKPILSFYCWTISEDNRSYLCRDCEDSHQKEYGCTTRNVITAMVMRPYTNLTRHEIMKYPYLIEANKFLILLKQLTK